MKLNHKEFHPLCSLHVNNFHHLLLLSKRRKPFLFRFCILMSLSFSIHMESSVCHPLPSLPCFIYLLCSGITVLTLCILRPRAAISLLCFPSSLRSPRRDPGRFSFFPFPLQSVPLLILSIRLLSSGLVVDFGELFVQESFFKRTRGHSNSFKIYSPLLSLIQLLEQ